MGSRIFHREGPHDIYRNPQPSCLSSPVSRSWVYTCPLGGGEQSHRIPTAHAPAGPIWLQKMGNKAAKYVLPAYTWKWDWVFKSSCHQDGKETLLRYWVWSVGSALTKSKQSLNFSRFNRTVSPDNQESRKSGFDLLLLMATQSIIFMLKCNAIHNKKKHIKFYNKTQSQNF